MHRPCDYRALAHPAAFLAPVLERQSLSDEAYAQSHLSRTRGWFHAPAGMATPPSDPPRADDSTVNIRRSVVLRSRQTATDEQQSKSVWNASVPVNRLPPEILLEIFQVLQAITEDVHDVWMVPSSYVFWPRLSHVCRAWRDVICNSAQLWRDIHVKGDLQWVELCLSRSREAPLHIFFHSGATLPDACDILSNHRHRIKTVVVFDTAPDTVSCLTQFFQPSMPMLEEFSLDAFNTFSDATCFSDSDIFPLLPALHTLRLGYAHIDWTSNAARKLRVLHLRDWTPPDDHLLSLHEFLSALQEFQALEDLNMDFAFPFETYNADGVRDVTGPIVTLPNIRSLYFLCPSHEEPSSPDIYHLLAHLRVPVSAKLHVYSQTQDHVTSSGEGGYLDTIPQDTDCLPILKSATTAQLWKQGFDCHCGEGQLGVDLEPMGDETQRWAYTPERAVDDFCTLFAKSPLVELAVRDMRYTEESWAQLFRTFPSLSVLKVKNESPGSDDDVEDGLLAALTPTAPDQATDSDPDSDDPVPLPNMRTMQYKGEWHEDTLSDLVHCLRARAARGVKLRKLTLRMFGRDPEDADGDARHESLLHELDELVEEPMVYADIPRPQMYL
ncbi:hypothetical protein L227DRAFT_617846 [Lentinus tigrinus ALCF2SS1-6]|uniref:F-box domain-containing protein n=2 Tax=Lentinus tigrinus TaxID=5365 RepID=A0A5C2RL70_9APHY|nr:hypothetical protein L227DRAFT_617846 [Lentinus tigrinus ALCF2SS1-6]